MRYSLSALLAGCALLAPGLEAQTVVFPPPIQAPSTPARFVLAPVGARDLGLGGAFVAVADDATAADSNPAGLARLDAPQVLVSLSSASFDTEFQGFFFRRETTSESVTGPAFAGWAHPLGRVTVAAYYQQDARFASGVRSELGEIVLDDPVLQITIPVTGLEARRYDQRRETVGVAAGTRLGSAVSLGAALRYQRLSLDWVDEIRFELPLFDPFPLPASFSTRTEVDDDGGDLTVALGLLVHPQGRWTGGLSFQQGGEHELSGVLSVTSIPIFPTIPTPFEITLELPDVWSAGAGFRPHERWLLTAQVSHLTYSDLEPEPVGTILAADLGISPFRGDAPIDDETRVHLGAEVRLGPASRPITLRAGAWSDPDHDGIRDVDTDEVHAALGAGTVLGERWLLDGAVRAGETVTQGMITLGYRF